MKKILLFIVLIVSVGLYNQSSAQCSGASVAITNFTINPTQTSITYSFNWTHLQGNASLQVAIMCNGVDVDVRPCIPRLADSLPGPHFVSETRAVSCPGILRVEIRIWTNNSCGGLMCVLAFREVSQSTLPVNFAGFSATRNQNTVALRWETASEQNNTGFAIERKTGSGWQQVAFVPSQGLNGNSNSMLVYTYSDPNSFKGISQYRIRQVDYDNRSTTTEIKAVRGVNNKTQLLVYPNPSIDGKINVVFEDASAIRDVTLSDMAGRVVKQMKGVTNNNIQFENLFPGVYSLRVIDRETGEQNVQKIVVNKR